MNLLMDWAAAVALAAISDSAVAADSDVVGASSLPAGRLTDPFIFLENSESYGISLAVLTDF